MKSILTTILPSHGMLKRRVLARYRDEKIVVTYDDAETIAKNHEIAAKILAVKLNIQGDFYCAESAESDNSYYWIVLNPMMVSLLSDELKPSFSTHTNTKKDEKESISTDGIKTSFIDMFGLKDLKI